MGYGLLEVPVVAGPKGHPSTAQQGGAAGAPARVPGALLGIGLLAPPTDFRTGLGVGVRLAAVGQLCDQLLVDQP